MVKGGLTGTLGFDWHLNVLRAAIPGGARAAFATRDGSGRPPPAAGRRCGTGSGFGRPGKDPLRSGARRVRPILGPRRFARQEGQGMHGVGRHQGQRRPRRRIGHLASLLPIAEGRYGDAQHACERAHLSDGHAAMIQRQDPLPSTRSAQTALQIRPSARPTAIIRKASSSPWLSSGHSTVRPAKILTGTPKPWPRSARTSASSASSSSRSMPVCSPWAQTVQGSAARDTGWPERHRTRVRRARTTSARFAMPHAASAAACFITSATSV